MNGDQRTEQGLIVEVQIEKSNLEDWARIMNEKYHPTWMADDLQKMGPYIEFMLSKILFTVDQKAN